MKKTMSLLLMSVMGMVGTYAFAGSDREDTIDRMQKSVDVLQSIMSTPDKGIPEEVLSGAKCIVVVPNLLKGGFIFGGKHGRGVASCRTRKAGALLHSSPLAVAAGDCRLESKAWIWSCSL
jgi:SH3 domain-containing YSC84-like protein 1